MQRGQIFKKGRSWSLRYRVPILENGEIVQLQVCKRVAPLDKKYESMRSIAPLALKFLAPVNAANFGRDSNQSYLQWASHLSAFCVVSRTAKTALLSG
jgi:hypothetical protein